MFITIKNKITIFKLKKKKEIKSSKKSGLKGRSIFKFLNTSPFHTSSVKIALKPGPEFSFPLYKIE